MTKETGSWTFNRKGNNTYSASKNVYSKERGYSTKRVYVVYERLEVSPEYPEDTNTQAASYRELRQYMKVPHTQVLTDEAGRKMLVLQYINSPSLRTVLSEGSQFNDPDDYIQTLDDFLTDLAKMWHRTRQQMDESQLVMNFRTASIATLEAALKDKYLAYFLKKEITSNGRKYPPLGQTIKECLARLRETRLLYMVQSHGDEHPGNILSIKSKKGEKPSYVLFDPRKFGYYSPAGLVNIFAGTPLLFTFAYPYPHNMDFYNQDIRFKLPSSEVWENYKTGVNKFLGVMNEVNDSNSLFKEYLFANLVRGAIARVSPKNYIHTNMQRPIYIALANEAFYNFDGFFCSNKT